MKIITILSAGSILLLSCTSGKKMTAPATPLYETKWSLKKIHSDAGVEEVATKAFIKFNQEKKSAGGNASCNTFGSNASINNNEVRFTNIFSTKMFCEGIQKTEDAFLKQLVKANRLKLQDKILLLYLDKEVLLEFAAVE